ncbi:hypothetical protein CMQ_863 [Grosmannia clavigera kw1407]|uniref:SnoaL-like domain-containing protein n=1 Tax=Grosmannia clavigera (strain kw1407 / UAMH 11150) TaxID=655863 RepID=F0XCU1_GROCL|nr:uncharacterized protein CMQ_863 [Grosmannia clavigera kw1407]EFX03935.1 hypothetical protein CMQ_863 [Grosmannia clavigera kw1407]
MAYIDAKLPQDCGPIAGPVQFFNDFYRISDTPEAHTEYCDMFSPDATFILASKTIVGSEADHTPEAILRTRQLMWSNVASRKHFVHKIFPFGSISNEFMLYGTVKYTTKAGDESEKEWAARAQLTETNGQWKHQFYQVYLDTGAAA